MKSFKVFKNTVAKELDLRAEMNAFMFGASDEIPKGQLVILRKMRVRDGILIPVKATDLQVCECKSTPSNEPDIDYRCGLCDGEGYLFDDCIIPGYKTDRFGYQDVEVYQKQGKGTVSMSFFFVEYQDNITRFDKVLEPVINKEGEVRTPVQILQSHNIHMAQRFKGDNGRIEYYRLSCFSE